MLRMGWKRKIEKPRRRNLRECNWLSTILACHEAFRRKLMIWMQCSHRCIRRGSRQTLRVSASSKVKEGDCPKGTRLHNLCLSFPFRISSTSSADCQPNRLPIRPSKRHHNNKRLHKDLHWHAHRTCPRSPRAVREPGDTAFYPKENPRRPYRFQQRKSKQGDLPGRESNGCARSAFSSGCSR